MQLTHWLLIASFFALSSSFASAETHESQPGSAKEFGLGNPGWAKGRRDLGPHPESFVKSRAKVIGPDEPEVMAKRFHKAPGSDLRLPTKVGEETSCYFIFPRGGNGDPSQHTVQYFQDGTRSATIHSNNNYVRNGLIMASRLDGYRPGRPVRLRVTFYSDTRNLRLVQYSFSLIDDETAQEVGRLGYSASGDGYWNGDSIPELLRALGPDVSAACP